jgi:dTDP-4-amino-4,6-dideoxygalactose transaminase
MANSISRRNFLAAAPLAAAASPLAAGAPEADVAKPAILGGEKTHNGPFPEWPKYDQTEEKALLDVLHTGKWYRGSGQTVAKFEQAYSQLTGAKYCLATANGTSALLTTVNALGVEPGDEVIVPPYTFIATVNAVLRQHALPVFVDTDLETFQMDARKVEAAISPLTRAMIPVHLGGSSCDLDTMLGIAAKHNFPLIEDACQAHLGEWKGRKVGTYGQAGCFSFQASKNLNSGEGGAIVCNDEDLRERCYAFHNNGSGLKFIGTSFSYTSSGANLRMTEFQGALLLAQMTRIENQANTRTENARYLTSMLKDIPGIAPAKMYDGCTRNAYHLYMFRYDKTKFNNAPRSVFLKALAAEGIPAASGYTPLNKQPFLKNAIASRGFQKLFPKKVLAEWEERTQCPVNDRLCEEAVWFSQNVLLSPRTTMDQIADAVRKIQANSASLPRA